MSAQAANVSPIAAVLEFVWDNFGKQILAESSKWGRKGIHWKLAADRYGHRLEQDYGKLFVLGQPQPKPIDDIYTYVHVLDRPTAFKRHAPEELESLFVARGLMHKEEERSDGLGKVQEGKNLFVLGKPGAGKTTFLKQVTMKAARGELTRVTAGWLRSMLPLEWRGKKEVTQLPIFISLRNHADSGRTLFESVEHELKICRFPEASPFISYLLHSGRALVLLDGLDEVRQDDEKRTRMSDAIYEFMREYRETQFLITCRVAAANYSFDNVHYLEMADFEDEQKRLFIHRWFDDRMKSDRCWEELQKEQNRGLREMARVPLLLTLLAITYEEALHFPQRRVEIYEEAVDALLKKWDARRLINRGDEVYKQLSLGYKRQMLARIAAKSFDEGEFLLSKRKLVEMIEAFMARVPGVDKADIDGEEILQSITARHGIFVEQAHNVYSFAHLSFQEYFTAKFIIANARQGTLERLLDNFSDDQWREVFLLTVSLVDDDADEFFKLFVERLNSIGIPDKSIQRILTWGKDKTEFAVEKKILAYRPVSLRAWYFSGVRHRDPNFDHVSDRALTLALALDHDLDMALALDMALGQAHNIARDIDPSHSRSSDLAHHLKRACDLSCELVTISQQLENYGLNEIRERLCQLIVPDQDASKDERAAFRRSLSQIFQAFRNRSGLAYLDHFTNKDQATMRELKLTHELINNIDDYLKATRLLVDCLPLAMVSDRTGIEDQLLLPAPHE